MKLNVEISYELTFFQKLVLCRDLKFALPQKAPPIDVMATFENVYWKIEPHLASDDMKEIPELPRHYDLWTTSTKRDLDLLKPF